VALVTFGPFAAALLVFYGSPSLDWLPRLPGSRELITPPLGAPAAWLADEPESTPPAAYRWSLIYARMAACERQCVLDLERLRQVQGALGKDSDRVRRVYLRGGEPPAHPADAGSNDGLGDKELSTRRLDDAQGEPIVRTLGADRLQLGRVLLADPSGNLIASYPPEVEQKELLRDLKRLLSVSGTN
jgi:hypothetical protein